VAEQVTLSVPLLLLTDFL